MHSPERFAPDPAGSPLPIGSPMEAPPSLGRVGSNPPPPLRAPGERSTFMGLGGDDTSPAGLPIEVGTRKATLTGVKPLEIQDSVPEIGVNSSSLGGDAEAQRKAVTDAVHHLNVAFEKGFVPEDEATRKALADLRATIARNIASS